MTDSSYMTQICKNEFVTYLKCRCLHRTDFRKYPQYQIRKNETFAASALIYPSNPFVKTNT